MILERLFDISRKEVKKDRKTVNQILALEGHYRTLSDQQLRRQTVIFKNRLKNGETTDDLLTDAFAVVREAAFRVLGMRHYPAQLIGGMVLHHGDIAEMPTGQGKTLAATLPVYLNALTGKGVYVVTVNDYLAKRDAEEMGKIYRFLGLSVGLIVNDQTPDLRKKAYACDITYGTSSAFGFDYLRDNMAKNASEQVQRGQHYAVIDEVDSILIDEARTPLIISKPCDENTSLYGQADCFARHLQAEDYEKDIKEKTVSLTERGIAKAEKFFHVQNIADLSHIDLMHAIHQALYAHVIMKRDIDYMVKDGKIIIVDTFTGRPMAGRRFSDGLHQAIEAKEHVQIQSSSKTMATVTLQNYFRMFDKIAGMTGTAKTEAEEFRTIYNLNTIVIPPNKPVIRNDMPDQVYLTEEAKFNAVIRDVKERHQTGQPVLIGTVSVEKSEKLSRKLSKIGIAHHVLNAKHLEQEAAIIAQAGQKNAVTIATNMAGRGTDIKLGKGVAALGGLHVIGTERHESRRIDNQLRGRAGRQGDPGSSQFYVSLEDDLIKRFAPERVRKLASSLHIPENEPIISRTISRSIEKAQRKIEAIHFDERKNVLKYDLVMNKQRLLIYKQRQMILDGTDLSKQIADTVNVSGKADQWQALHALLDDETLDHLERQILLKNVDFEWENHMDDMDNLRQGIGLRSYGQNDPVVEYIREGSTMFNNMTKRIQKNTMRYLFGFLPKA